MDRHDRATDGEQLLGHGGNDYDGPTYRDSPTYHYHVNNFDNYYQRTPYYHDHAGSFLFNDDGTISHDHKFNPATYVNHIPTKRVAGDGTWDGIARRAARDGLTGWWRKLADRLS